MPLFFSKRRTVGGGRGTQTATLSLGKKKKGEIFEKCLHPHLKRRHLTVTNQIHSVIEFPISAKLIRERKHNNSEWHISEGGDFKEQHQGTPEPPLAEFLHKYAVKQYDVLLLPESMLRARVGSIWSKRLSSPKEIVSTPHISLCYWIPWLLTGLTHFLVNTNSILTAAVFYLPCVPPLRSSLASSLSRLRNHVEIIFLYWIYTNYKLKMKCYYMCAKRGDGGGGSPQQESDPFSLIYFFHPSISVHGSLSLPSPAIHSGRCWWS